MASVMSQGLDRGVALAQLALGTGLGYLAWRVARSSRPAWLKWTLAALAVVLVVGGLILFVEASFSARSISVFTMLVGLLFLGWIVWILRRRCPRFAKISLVLLGLSLLPAGLDLLTAFMEVISGLRAEAANAAADQEK